MTQQDAHTQRQWTPVQLLSTQGFLAGYVLALLFAVANTQFLIDFGSGFLPHVYVVSAVIIPLVTAGYNAASRRVSERRLLQLTMPGIVVVYALGTLSAFGEDVRWVSFALMVGFNLLFVFQFLLISLQSTRLFNLREMKSRYPIVLASQTGAVILGGISVTLLSRLLGSVTGLLWVCVGLAIISWIVTNTTVTQYRSRFEARTSAAGPQQSATILDVLRRPFSRHIFLYRFLSGLGTELIVVLFVIQAERRFAEAESLAAFFGGTMAVGTFLTLITLVFLAGRLLRRYGLSFGIMINPILAATPILGLFLAPLFGTAAINFTFALIVAARIVDFVFSVATTEPSVKTMYQALPESSRAAVVTLVEAISLPATYGVVGVSLLLLNQLQLMTDTILFIYTVVACGAWSYIGWRTYQLYASTLLSKLSRRTVSDVDLTLEDPASLGVVQSLIQSEQLYKVKLGLGLLQKEDHPAYAPSVLALLESPNAIIQIEALQRVEKQPRLLADSSVSIDKFLNEGSNPASVRAAALRAHLAADIHDIDRLKQVELAVNDKSSEVRLGAMVALLQYGGLAGQLTAGQRLQELSESSDPKQLEQLANILAELDQHNYHQPLAHLLSNSDIEVRRSALKATLRVRHPLLIPAVTTQLGEPALRSHAVDALVHFGDMLLPAVQQALSRADQSSQNEQPSPTDLRLIRVCGLLSNETFAPILLPYLDHPNSSLRDVILLALVRSHYAADTAESQKQVRDAIETAGAKAAELADILEAIEGKEELQLLCGAVQNELNFKRTRILRLLSLIYNRQTVIRIISYLTSSDSGEHAQAVESADLLLEPTHRQIANPLIDPELSSAQKANLLRRRFQQESRSLTYWIDNIIVATDEYSDWTQACAILGASKIDLEKWQNFIRIQNNPARPIAFETAAYVMNAHFFEVKNMLIIERVSLLKSTNIFNNVPETVLASLASVTRVVELAADEQFIQDGEMARELYIIVEGCVRVQKNGVKVIDLNAGESVGELAIFDPEPRSADVIALEPTVLLQLDKEPFEEVMADRPEISQGVIQALSRRIREQGRQMAG